MIGQTLGAYTIERELGRGGMGAVYTAVHNMLGRRAAVKVLLPEMSRHQEVVQRFFNEARAATAIKHPSIVEIYDFGWAPDGSAYIVMEMMDGEALAARLARAGRLSVPAALTIARQIATALAAAHKANIVHRDLKPDNVFLVPDPEVIGGERVKLLDFGIAKLVADGVSRTSTGAVLGTPLYMSPEQCQGAKLVDARSDLYSLGCMLFEMLAGRPPFVSEGVGELIGMHQFVAPPPLRALAPDVPPEVDALVARLLAKAPGDRHQSAAELATALGQVGAVSAAMPAASPAISGAMHAATRSQPPTGAGSAHGAPSGHPITTLSQAAVAASAPPRAPARSRTGLWLGLGGIGVAGAVIAIVVASGGGKGGATAPADAALAVAAIDASIAVAPDADVIAVTTADAAAVAPIAVTATDAAAADPVAVATPPPPPTTIDAGVPVPDPVATKAIADQRKAIEGLVKAGDCDGARSKAKKAVERWGDEAKPLTAVAARCKPAATVGAGDGSTTPPPPTSTKTAAQLIAEAQAAATAGQAARSLALAEAALQISSLTARERDMSTTLATLGACNTKNAGKAKKYYGLLPPTRQTLLRQACLKQGIELL